MEGEMEMEGELEGFYLSIPSADVRSHLEKRIVHHSARVDWYKSQLGALEEEDDNEEDSSNVRRPSMRNQLQRHQRTLETFKFYLQYIPEGVTYRVRPHEIEQIEMVTLY